MGTSPPTLVLDLVERFSRDRKVFLSGDYKEERLSKAKTPHVRAGGLRLTAYGPGEAEIRLVDGDVV
jgi:hypothetical protein